MRALKLLLIEDIEDDALLILDEIRSQGIEVNHQRVESEPELKKALKESYWDFVISDYNLPGFSGLEALRIVRNLKPDLPFILISGTIGDDLAAQSIKLGATDYLLKDNLVRLGYFIERAIQDVKEKQELKAAEEEIKEKNRQLLASQRLESIGRLASGIAHDFNNKLGIINLVADSLLKAYENDPELVAGLKQILTATKNASDLTRQLLAFSRKQNMKPVVVQLHHEISKAVTMLDRVVGDDIAIEIDLDETLPNVEIDPSQLDQIILNLVINARDAMPEGGKITLKTEYIKISEDAKPPQSTISPGSFVLLAVSDTGSGINEDIRNQIFEPFFTTKNNNKGTGLGLSMVYGIVKQSNGYIEVESSLNQGTTFSIYFPTTTKPIEIIPEEKSDLSKPRRLGKIMVVEDDPDLREAFVSILKAEGFEVSDFEDPIQAIEASRKHKTSFNLLLTDMTLPNLSGADLIEEIKKDQPQIQCVICSGYADSKMFKNKKKLIQEIPWLSKPFTRESLLAALYGAIKD